MKINNLVLTLLSLLFVSGSVFAEDIEVGCLHGDCVNGRGTLVEVTERGEVRYVGAFVNGLYDGYGRLTFVDEGLFYKGRWKQGEKSGYGVLWDSENNVYMGAWLNDRRNGTGGQFYRVEGWVEGSHGEPWLKENTENYTGEFKNGVFYGYGTYRWADGVKYIGEWAANKKHGKGYFDYGTGMRSNREFEFDVAVFN